MDVGRHAAQYQLSKLCGVLSGAQDSSPVIRVSLFAIMHISLDYADVPPYGRVEPLNGLIVAIILLDEAGRRREAELGAEVLGVISIRTKQLDGDRARSYLSDLTGPLAVSFNSARRCAETSEWLPGSEEEDPWR